MLSTYLREEFRRNLLTKFAGLVALPVINAFKRRVDHRRYNGASLLGLRGIVIKSHGSADSHAFGFAIARAVDEVRGGMLRHISESVAQLPHHPENPSSYPRTLAEEKSGMMYSRVIGTGSYLPEKILTNQDLEHMVDTSDEWIRTRTGIAQRHIAADNEMASDLALNASREAMEAAGVTLEISI